MNYTEKMSYTENWVEAIFFPETCTLCRLYCWMRTGQFFLCVKNHKALVRLLVTRAGAHSQYFSCWHCYNCIISFMSEKRGCLPKKLNWNLVEICFSTHWHLLFAEHLASHLVFQWSGPQHRNVEMMRSTLSSCHCEGILLNAWSIYL